MASISLVKFHFTPTGKTTWLEWCDELKRRSDEVYATLKNEGVYTEACFLSETENACFYLMQAVDIKKVLEVSEKSRLRIDIEHQNALKKSLVYVERYKPLFLFSKEEVDAEKQI